MQIKEIRIENFCGMFEVSVPKDTVLATLEVIASRCVIRLGIFTVSLIFSRPSGWKKKQTGE